MSPNRVELLVEINLLGRIKQESQQSKATRKFFQDIVKDSERESSQTYIAELAQLPKRKIEVLLILPDARVF